MYVLNHDWGVYVEEIIKEKNGSGRDIFEDESCVIRYIKDLCRNVKKYNAPLFAMSISGDRVQVLFGEMEEEEVFKIMRITNSSFAWAMAQRGMRVKFTRKLRYCMDPYELSKELKRMTDAKDAGGRFEKWKRIPFL